MTTVYHAKYLAHELTKRCPSDSLQKLAATLADAQVDLNPHQIDAALFAFRSPLSKGAILADEVGLGKTIEAGILLSQKWAEGERKLLIIVPAALRKQWNQELSDKFFLPSVILENRSFKQIIKQGNLNPFVQKEIIICSYHFARAQDVYIKQVNWNLVIVDEAHRLRNVYKPANRIANAIKNAIAHAPKVLLTATPLQNSIQELYGLVSIVDDYTFGDLKSFKAQFGLLRTEEDFAALRERIKPVVQRTLRRQVLEYIKYTNRIPITQEFVPSDAEQRLYDLVSRYLQRETLYALPSSQRQLMTLICRKLLASSTYAISGTLAALASRLETASAENTATVAPPDEVAADFEAIDEVEEEWGEDETTEKAEPIYTAEDKERMRAEIKSLREFKELAASIVKNSKGEVLLTALEKGFAKARELGAPEKTIIFTESTRTQEYLCKVLEQTAYAGKIVLFNGSNKDAKSKQIYAAWMERHKGTDRVTGAPSADMRQALVDYGNTSFAYTSDGETYGIESFSDGVACTGTYGSGVINRSALVVDPTGATNLYVYRDLSQSNNCATPFLNYSYNYGVPGGVYYDEIEDTTNSFVEENVYMYFRNSWHWGPTQLANLSTSDMSLFETSDYLKGRSRHWLHIGGLQVGDSLAMEAAPSPNGSTPGQLRWYLYDGMAGSDAYQGTIAQPSVIAQLLPDGKTWYQQFFRDYWAHATNIVDSYSAGFGTPTLLRTNQYLYAPNGLDLAEHIGPNGEIREGYAYDGHHHVLSLTNAVTNVTTYAYDTHGRQTSVTTPTLLTTTKLYFGTGTNVNFVQADIDASGATSYGSNAYTYANDLVATSTDKRGLTLNYAYDKLQRLTSVTYPDATTFLNIYSKLDRIDTTDRLGSNTWYQYDGDRRLITVTNALSKITTYNYCTCGGLDYIQDALGNRTTFSYDNEGRLIYIGYPDTSSLNKYYDAVNRLTNTVDGAGVSISYWYTDNGLLYASSNAFGQVFQKKFDIEDRITSRTDGNGVSITNTYDNSNRMLTRTYPYSGVEEFGYSPAGISAYTNQLGYTNGYTYDAAGRKVSEANANQEVTQYGYDAAGDLTNLTDAKLNTTKWGYDAYGRVTNKVDANGTTILTYEYDVDSRLTDRWSLQKANTGYGYDGIGNLLTVTYPVSHAVSFGYDADNRMTSMSDGIGTTAFAYTAVGLLQSEAGPWANDTVAFTYANMLRKTVSVQQPSASSWSQSYGYDAANRLKTITSPAGAFTYIYDTGLNGTTTASALIDQVNLPNGAGITNTFDDNARLTATLLRNSTGTTLDLYEYAYNKGNQRTNVVRGAVNANYADYAYDPIGQIVSDQSSDVAGAVRLNEQLAYAYDHAHNLAYRTNNTLIQNFQVNTVNELTTQTNGGRLTVVGTTTSAATNVTVNGTNALFFGDTTFAATNMPMTNSYTAIAQDIYGRHSTNVATVSLSTNSTFQYDLNGNLTNDGLRNLMYNEENELIQVSVSNQWMSQFSYDGKMRRRIRQEFTWTNSAWAQTNQVFYVYDGNLAIQERNLNNLPTITYTRGKDLSGSLEGAGGIGGLLARTDVTSGQTACYHADANGNITMLINSTNAIVAKYLYDAFGNVLSQSGALAAVNLYRFSSKEAHLNSGLVYYLYRFYDPNLQQWPNRDPLTEPGFEALRFHSNRSYRTTALLGGLDGNDLYEFVRNESIGSYDALGLEASGPNSEACKEAKQKVQNLLDTAQRQFDYGDPAEAYATLAEAQAASAVAKEICSEPTPPTCPKPEPEPKLPTQKNPWSPTGPPGGPPVPPPIWWIPPILETGEEVGWILAF